MYKIFKRYLIFFLVYFNITGVSSQVSDTDVKVAYVYRFTDYIDWPENIPSKVFSIGVFSNDEVLLNKFEYLAQNREIDNKKIEITAIKDINGLESKRFDILYLNTKHNDKIVEVFAAILHKNTLLITDNCANKETVMINFLPSVENTVRFEINKKTIVDEGLAIHPDILLLGGSYVDVRQLFREKEQELENEKEKLRESKIEVQKQKELIREQDSVIEQKENIISLQNKSINEQAIKLERLKTELGNLSEEINQKQDIIQERALVLHDQERQIAAQKEKLEKTTIELKNRNKKLEDQEKQINYQSDVLFEQLTRIRFQQNILYISIAIIFLVLSLVYFIYRGFKIKKHANIKLEEYNSEILAQNEEIISQREEIITARDTLKEINSELEKLSVVASKTSNAVIITSSDGIIEWVNEGYTKLFGYKQEELTKKFGENIIANSLHNMVEQKIALCKQTKQTVEYLALNTTKSGQQLWMHSSMTPILDENNEIKKLIIIEANVTDLKIAEENIKQQKEEIEKQNVELEKYRNHLEKLVEERTQQLMEAKEKAEESDRLKSAFIANMSHEIRTPMNAVVGFSSLLNQTDIKSSEASEYIKIINSNARSLMQLIDDIIDLSRIEAGKLIIKKFDFDVNSMVDELYTIYTQRIKKDNPNITLILQKEFMGQRFFINSDKIRINQILINLLDNALKFTNHGSIVFGYELKNENTIMFFVSDTGIGIEHDKHSAIFERFLKIETDNKKLYRGVGLGLSISKSIIEELGGEINVNSTIGEGSKFFFTVPIK